MKRSTLNIVLAVVVVGVLLLIWQTRDQAPPEVPLTRLVDADIDRIEFSVHDDPPLVFQRERGAWHLSEPVQAPADPGEVASLLRVSRQSMHQRFPLAELSPTQVAQMGLDEPQTLIRYNDIEVAFGGIDPVTYRRYVRVGDEVVQIDDPAGVPQNTEHATFIAKPLLPEGAALSRIETPDVVAFHDDTRGWRLDPDDPSVESDRIQAFADAWRRARGMWTGRAGEREMEGEPVRLVLADGEVIDLIVTARDPQLIITRPDYRVRYHVSKAMEQELLQLPELPDGDEVGSPIELPDLVPDYLE